MVCSLAPAPRTKIFTRLPYPRDVASVLFVAPRRIPDDAGREAVQRWRDGNSQPDDEAMAVRYTLQLLRQKAPGSSVEVRVPPWGAVQAIEGPSHTRGTPPAVVEMTPDVWLSVATGTRQFEQALAEGAIHASGERSNLTGWLPLGELA